MIRGYISYCYQLNKKILMYRRGNIEIYIYKSKIRIKFDRNKTRYY